MHVVHAAIPLILFVITLTMLWIFGLSHADFYDEEKAFKASREKSLILKQYMQVIISGVLVLAALYVILSNRYSDSEKNWAYATIGTILGFWIKT